MQIVMKLYIIAGEKSGDIHGALLLKNLLRLMPGMEVAGLGGQGMHALCPGVEDWADEAAVIGVVEVLKKYGTEKYVSFDLGLLNQYNYYTGVIFKGYTYGDRRTL